MNKIYCEHPVVIWHPQAAARAARYRTFSMPSGIYKGPKLHVNKNHVTEKNIDSYRIIDPSTGETFPMFLIVPCNKCRLCAEKKAQSWSFRALCESFTSKKQAYFITLTYNNEHLPSSGVFPEEIQLFFKRLRIRLDRQGVEHNLRYIAVSEYGHNSGRPHYHIILWNFPDNFENAYSRLKLIESCWKRPTGSYNPDGSPVTESIGFAYCVPVIQGGINYVMKYMSKKQSVPPGMNPTFMLASKRQGGIGSAFAEQMRNYYEASPETIDISVMNIYTSQPLTIIMPRYYKCKYAPTVSQAYDANFTKHFKQAANWFETARHLHRMWKLPFKFTYPEEYLHLLRQTRNSEYYNPAKIEINYTFINYYVQQFLNIEVKKDLYARAMHMALEELATAIVFYRPSDPDKLDKSIRYNTVYTSALNVRMADRIELNIKKAAYDIQNKLYKHYRKEKI